MKRKKDMSFFATDSNTQTQQEVQIATEREPEDFSGETDLESEGSEQGEKDEESQSEIEERCASTSAGTSDISKCKEELPMQPNFKLFPRTLMGDRRRSFKGTRFTPGLSTPKCQTLLIVTPADILALRIAQTLNLIHLQVSKRLHTKRGDLQSMPNLSGTRKQ